MERSWKEARAIQQRSGWGVRAELFLRWGMPMHRHRQYSQLQCYFPDCGIVVVVMHDDVICSFFTGNSFVLVKMFHFFWLVCD